MPHRTASTPAAAAFSRRGIRSAAFSFLRRTPHWLLLCSISGLPLLCSCGKQSEAPPASPPTVAADPAADQTSPRHRREDAPDYSRLIGRWVRPNGGFIIEIKQIGENGRLEARYLDPDSIHVSRAQASQAGPLIKVFLELKDEGYPASNYTLVYNPNSDQLTGVYYDGEKRRSEDVVFVRTP